MTENSSLHRKQFDCSTCDRSVIYRYSQKEITVGGNVVRTELDKIFSYGQCQIALEAKVPNNPVLDEILNCPFYRSIR